MGERLMESLEPLHMGRKSPDALAISLDNEEQKDLPMYRRLRTRFTSTQLAELELIFRHTHYPDPCVRNQLSQKTGLAETKIQVWFQNRRAKFKRIKKSNCPIPSMEKVSNLNINHEQILPNQNTTQMDLNACSIYDGQMSGDRQNGYPSFLYQSLLLSSLPQPFHSLLYPFYN